MYPIAHMTLAAGGVRGVDRIWHNLKPRTLPSRIDYRLIAIGSLIPDAIDKPLAWYGEDYLGTGHLASHSIGHTLLFSICFITLGLLVARMGERRLLWLALGAFTHLLVDPVIFYPHILLWPAFGSDFPTSNGLSGLTLQLIDATLVVIGGITLLRSRTYLDRARSFLRTGAFPGPPDAELDRQPTSG